MFFYTIGAKRMKAVLSVVILVGICVLMLCAAASCFPDRSDEQANVSDSGSSYHPLSGSDAGTTELSEVEDIGGANAFSAELSYVPPALPANIRMDKLYCAEEVHPPLETARVSSLFGYRKNPVTGKYTFHSGYDLAAPEGSEIRSVMAGKVLFAAYAPDYGYHMIVEHSDGLQTLYAHCKKLLRKSGDSVAKGEVIALVGSTGNSTGAHLHIEFRLDGQRYDPEWQLGGMYD